MGLGMGMHAWRSGDLMDITSSIVHDMELLV